MADKTLNGAFPFTEYEVCSVFAIDGDPDGRAVDAGSLRSILLTKLNGLAVRAFALSVTVEDEAGNDEKSKSIEYKALHEYKSLDHVREDVSEIKRNIQALVVVDPDSSTRKTLEAEYELIFDGDDAEFDISCEQLMDANESLLFVPGRHIVTLVKETGQKIKLKLWLYLGEGVGFVEAERNRKDGDEKAEARIGQRIIPIDARYSPVVFCAVSSNESSDKTLLEIKTNGSITPREALRRACDNQFSFVPVGRGER